MTATPSIQFIFGLLSGDFLSLRGPFIGDEHDPLLARMTACRNHYSLTLSLVDGQFCP